MSDQKMARWMGLTGFVILVLVFLSFGPINGKTPSQNASGATVVAYYSLHGTRQMVCFYLAAVAIGLLIFYASSLRSQLRGAEGGRAFWSTAAFGAGVVLVGGVLASGIFDFCLILASRNHLPAVAQTLNFVNQNDYIAFLFGASAMTLATAGSILNRSSLPKWLGWVSLVVGVACAAGPISFFGLIAFGVWLPVAGVVIGRHDPLAAQRITTHPVHEPVTTG